MIEWDNFRRYASWMRRLNLNPDSSVPEGALHMILIAFYSPQLGGVSVGIPAS